MDAVAQQVGDLLRSKALVTGLAVLSHAIFSSEDFDMKYWIIVPSLTALWSVLGFVVTTMDPRTKSLAEGISITLSAGGVYLGSLALSIIVYRAFFHRLRKFPGPFISRITKFHNMYLASKNNQFFLEQEKMHAKYGPIVRLGPRALSIMDTDAIQLIHGATSKCKKGTWYKVSNHMEGVSLQTCQDKTEHRERRKIWDRAFNSKSLREFEPRINKHTFHLIQKLREHSTEERECLSISNWVNFYSFDVMGDIGFNKSFEMLENGKEHPLIKALHNQMAAFTWFSHAPWLINMLLHTPFGVKDTRDFMDWTKEVLMQRKKVEPKEPDVFSWLLDPKDEEIPLHLQADTRLLVVAGSDTTAATLTFLAYELCKNPDKQEKLRKIIDKAAGEKGFLDVADLADIPYLDGVINETMRLHPAVPGGVVRETPPSGLMLKDTFIPGSVHIWTPIYTIQRSPLYFTSPLSFIPERWTSEAPEMVLDKRAFLPFQVGPYNCIGQKLAMMELRCVVANLVRSFVMEWGRGEDGRRVERETRDCFTTNVGALDVRLVERAVGK